MSRATSNIAASILLGSLMLGTGPPMWRLAREATKAVAVPYELRREQMMGEFYTSLRRLQRTIPVDALIGIVLRSQRDVDRGVFVNYYLYPRQARMYFGLDQYRTDTRKKPDVLLRVDLDRTAQVRRMTYEEIQAEDFPTLIMQNEPLRRVPSQEFLVPLVASLEGSPPNIYVTEGIIAAETAGTLTLQFFLLGKVRPSLLWRTSRSCSRTCFLKASPRRV